MEPYFLCLVAEDCEERQREETGCGNKENILYKRSLAEWLNDCLTDCVQSWNSPSLRWVMLSDLCEIQDHRDVDWLLWNFPYSLPLPGSSFKLSRVSLLQWRLILAQRTLAWIQGYVYCSVTHKYAALTRTEMGWSTTLWIWQKWGGVQLYEYDRNGVEYNSMNTTEMEWSTTLWIRQKWSGVQLYEYDRNGVEYNSMNTREMGWSTTLWIWNVMQIL
jgi:hypothetical protein